MTALNYQGFPTKSQVLGTMFLTITCLTLAIALPKPFVYAGCSEIEDLDDRATCYAEKIEKKEKEYESISKKLENIRKTKEKITQKIGTLASQISVTQEEIAELEYEINEVSLKLDQINLSLADKKTALEKKVALRNTAVRHYAKKGPLLDLEIFFGLIPTTAQNLTSLQSSTLIYMFDKTVKEEALRWIGVLNDEIASFEKDKKEGETLKTELESAQKDLVAVKNTLADEQFLAQKEEAVLAAEESNKESTLKSLEEEIAELSEKQQAILRQKYGDGIITGYEAPEYKLPNPPFKPAFAAMSYGAYTHYKGMSQYGAKGRANDGKDYKDIIEFYYKEEVKEKDDFPNKLCVEGYGKMDFQKYLYGLAEMPSDWPKDALKAQAIAARAFAYRYQKKGSCICTTQSCQVFSKSKSDNPPSRWKEAVDDTEDKIVSGDVVTYYSSTTGGYIENIGWDKDGSWPSDAYEKKAKSPWFYKAWYTETYKDNSSTCGRSTPWLNMEEMTDILNAWVVWRKGSGDEKDHISPVTTSCWGGDPYSHSKMAEKADKYDDKYTNISSISVDISNNGTTSKVHFSTNNGPVSIDGEEFKTVFNLRAPAYVSLRSRLFDIEVEK